MGTEHKPYELLATPCPVLLAVNLSIMANVDYIREENPTVASAAGQLALLPISASFNALILARRHYVFCFALLFACFRICLFRSNCVITSASSFLSASTFFWYLLRVWSNEVYDKFTQGFPCRTHSEHFS
jgi:hypothetical protein